MTDLTFHTAPKDQGQIVTWSYAADPERGRYVRRIFDASDRSAQYAEADMDDLRGEFEPWNGADNLEAMTWVDVKDDSPTHDED